MKDTNNKDLGRIEFELVSKIAKRAYALTNQRTILDWAMDIDAAHESRGLYLQDLLNASNGEFLHDTVGIYHALDRTTKTLDATFVPIYSK